jgi:adenylate kinase family enzyme
MHKEEMMERILIIGCPGAGKTTLARKLGEKLNLPVVHLDSIFWSPGNWVHLEQADFDKALQAEQEKPKWIIEGNYNRTLPMRLAYCDAVIWLDFSRSACMAGWFKRMIANWRRVRPDMAPGCLERFEWEFAKFIWNFRKDHGEEYYRLLNEAENIETVVLKNRRMVRKFLQTLER